MEVVVARWNWERFKAGEMNMLSAVGMEGIKKVYGAEWERNAVKLKIEEVGTWTVLPEEERERLATEAAARVDAMATEAATVEKGNANEQE